MTWVPKLELVVQGSGDRIDFPVQRLLNGGYAGRDQEAVWKHVEELAVIGVPEPSTTPTLYALGNNLATTADTVQVQHETTSGEVEYVLLIGAGETYVTVGSDQTDRDLETRSIEWSKQAYPDVFAPEVWRYQEVADHWEDSGAALLGHQGREPSAVPGRYTRVVTAAQLLDEDAGGSLRDSTGQHRRDVRDDPIEGGPGVRGQLRDGDARPDTEPHYPPQLPSGGSAPQDHVGCTER